MQVPIEIESDEIMNYSKFNDNNEDIIKNEIPSLIETNVSYESTFNSFYSDQLNNQLIDNKITQIDVDDALY